MARPGVMFYFDWAPGFERLSLEKQGKLFKAILDYGQYGVVPEFEDQLTSVIWEMIRPRMDKDNAAYERRARKKNKNKDED